MKTFRSLKNRKEFGDVYDHKRSYANKFLIMYALNNQKAMNRYGISVSKKVGNSVVRHRVTRLIREAIRLNQIHIQKGYDIVCIARKEAAAIEYREMESALLHLLKMHRLMN